MNESLELNETWNLTGYTNGSYPNSSSTTAGSIDVIRIRTLAFFLFFALIGNVSMLAWIQWNRREKIRIHLYMFHLALADLFVALGPLLSQIILIEMGHIWLLDEVSCRFFSFVLSFTMMATSNIVAVIAIDMHQCVLHPFKKPNQHSLVLAAWLIAAILSLPQFYVWGIYHHQPTDRYFCISIALYAQPYWHQNIYVAYISLVVFFIPFCLITILYLRVSCTVARSGKKVKQGKNNYRKRVKLKTMRMTIVLVLVFIATGLPYFIIEMQKSFGLTPINEIAESILGIFAVSACAFNPYVFLIFNVKKQSEKRASFSNSNTRQAANSN